MKILVVGGGGREHAIIKALKKSPMCGEIFCAPGNGGIAADATCVNIGAKDIEAIRDFAVKESIDFCVVAPDDPLVMGAVDLLKEAGIKTFGPDKKAAIIEGSKAFSKDLMKKYGIPTAAYETFTDMEEALKYVETCDIPVACAAAGIIIGVVTKTGVGLKLASGLLTLSGGLLLPTMFFTMITAILLGMGVPTTANYVITSTIAAPALVQMGVPVLAAHMFVFYFGIIADVTPPVALAAYAGSGISGGNALKTGVNASKLAIAAFIIPYIFVMSPVLLMQSGTVPELLLSTITALGGMVAISSALIGFLAIDCKAVERIILVVAGLLMIQPGAVTDIIGLVLFAVILAGQLKRRQTVMA